ncbi:MAG: OadG family protein [Spirochaetaceae bacterium]|jgi:oxaloacetate decarboxylase gamma subunit|nr:OadG family protein [Spirochaetaceae bacterium]
MTIAEMLEQSGVLTLLGMGIVSSFLVILIVCVSLVGKVIHALGMDKDKTAPIPGGASPSGGASAGNAAVTAAISAAITEYRKTANP